MKFQEGNQFWKNRSKHGRDKLFATPELLWIAATEYFQWCEENPWQKIETTVKPNGIEAKTIPTARPFTLTGLCLYLNASENYWKEFRLACKKNNDTDFLAITTRVEEIIYTQKYEGAAVGAFNANIIARDLGLKENISNEIIDKRKDISELFPDESELNGSTDK
jgi:hypothetical protein